MNKTFLDFKQKNILIEDHSRWLLQAMDVTAEHLHGEFGYDTCSHSEKLQVLQEMIENGDFDELGIKQKDRWTNNQ